MSYILDALKRADAERALERDLQALPTIHSLQASHRAIASNEPVGTRKGPWLVAGLLVGGLLIAAAWWGWQQWRTRASLDHSPVTLRASGAILALPAEPPVTPPAAKSPSASNAGSAGVHEPTVTVSAAPPAAKVAAEVPLLNELPAAQRAQWPDLTINSAVYSRTASDRLLIVGGAPLREGDTLPGTGVSVLTIGRSAATFAMGDSRVRVSY